MAQWVARQRGFPDAPGLNFADVDDLSPDLLDRTNPLIVLSPLVVRNTDAVEVADRLQKLGFRGRYRVVADPLPDTDIIHLEVATVAPGLDFGIMSLPLLGLKD